MVEFLNEHRPVCVGFGSMPFAEVKAIIDGNY